MPSWSLVSRERWTRGLTRCKKRSAASSRIGSRTAKSMTTASAPRWQHAMQSATDTVASSDTKTGAPVVDGKVYVNNGFWDTYRTTWSA